MQYNGNPWHGRCAIEKFIIKISPTIAHKYQHFFAAYLAGAGDANLMWNIGPLLVAQLHAEACVHMLAFVIRIYNLLAVLTTRTHTFAVGMRCNCI